MSGSRSKPVAIKTVAPTGKVATSSPSRRVPAAESVAATPEKSESRAAKSPKSAGLAVSIKSAKSAVSTKRPVSAGPGDKAVRRTKTASKSSAKPTKSKSSSGLVSEPSRRWSLGSDGEGTVKIQKAGEVVADRLRKQIATGALPIGHQLPREEELTTMFGIARTTLREALRVLESQGLLEIKRGRGGGGIVTMPKLDNLSASLAMILQLQATSLGDLDEARMMIEPPLVGRLAVQHTDEDLDVLNLLIRQASEAAESEDREKFGAAAAALHETIIARGGNKTMAVIGGLLHDLLERHLRQAAVIASQEFMQRAVRSYRKLVELIEAGDPAAASAHWHRQLVFLHQRRATVQLLDVYVD